MVDRGKPPPLGVPLEMEVKRRREVCEWEGGMSVCETTRGSSMLRLIHRNLSMEVMILLQQNEKGESRG